MSNAPNNLPFTQINRYEVRGLLGEGGMAAVYRGYDPNFKREIAIKVLDQQIRKSSSDLFERFQREAYAVARLEHPAIVPVYDFGEHEGRPFLVMRLMSGGDLASRIRKGAFSPKQAADILARLAPALDAAHAKGIIHRDLKPGNILFDEWNNAYISDFGIAKIAEHQATRTGTLIGTPAYMSPEQARGDTIIDGRSDIYALGVVYFEMLAGDVPFNSDTPIALAMKHVLDPVPLIEDRRPGLPSACDEVIQKAMAKEPDDRFANAAELVEAAQYAAAQSSDVDAPTTSTLRPSALTPRVTTRPGTLSETPTPVTEAPHRPPLAVLLGIGAVIILTILGGIFFLNGGLPITANLTETPSVTTTATLEPSATATLAPSTTPTDEPTAAPTEEPTLEPTLPPTPTPVVLPTLNPANYTDRVRIGGAPIFTGFNTLTTDQILRDGFRGALFDEILTDNIAFARFCQDTNLEIAAVTRPINIAESRFCQASDRVPTEFPIAIEALAIVTHPGLDFIDSLTLEELGTALTTATTWQDVRANWPATAIRLIGPDVPSGNYEFIADVTNVNQTTIRTNRTLTISFDARVALQNIASTANSLGFVNYTTYILSDENVRLIPIEGVAASESAITAGDYPITRTLRYYTDTGLFASNPSVAMTMVYVYDNLELLTGISGFLPPAADVQQAARQTLLDALP